MQQKLGQKLTAESVILQSKSPREAISHPGSCKDGLTCLKAAGTDQLAGAYTLILWYIRYSHNIQNDIHLWGRAGCPACAAQRSGAGGGSCSRRCRACPQAPGSCTPHWQPPPHSHCPVHTACCCQHHLTNVVHTHLAHVHHNGSHHLIHAALCTQLAVASMISEVLSAGT